MLYLFFQPIFPTPVALNTNNNNNRLFEEHAELLGLFNKFRELKTKEQQASSEELGEHANKVMETLDEGIRSLEDLDTFFAFLHQVGGTHTRIQGFKADYFWVSRFSPSNFENSLTRNNPSKKRREKNNDFLRILFSYRSQKIEKPFLSAVETTLGERYSANVEGIYKLTIKFIIETLITGFEGANSTQNNSSSDAKTNNNTDAMPPKS